MGTFREILEQTRRQIREETPERVSQRLEDAAPPLLVDVREPDETQQGFIPGAVLIPRGFLELRIEDKVPDRERPVVVYCAGGTRSALAARTLEEMGYHDVTSMSGGFNGWKERGLKFKKPVSLRPDQQARYSRHVLLPEVGEEGQVKLLEARVLLIGAGGLGSPAGLYLAAAGVGTLGVLDFDVVDESNLQRQVLHSTDRIGMAKTESAAIAIKAINPDVKVVQHNVRLSSENVMEIISEYDIIVDGSDNFATRYLLNDAAVWTGKRIVHGSIFRFDGFVTVIDHAAGGPCYRCIYPEPPDPDSDLAPNCAEAGVLGVLPGTVGVIQATEAVKLILGIGDPLVGRQLYFDALDMVFRVFKARRNPECPVCGEHPTITELIDYEEFCNIPASRNGHLAAPPVGALA
ncbi:MAG TPA: molybdopterin-synthase adenylyltransferase MoeB [Candidatus Dormibacteraeota bacterium]|jgi:adenylyltransferase/sulfurtransferase|nr:molybdopterin-synthase adenylyltransferase MoeB [Candidatus Dormibacteraeota bacterium]